MTMTMKVDSWRLQPIDASLRALSPVDEESQLESINPRVDAGESGRMQVVGRLNLLIVKRLYSRVRHRELRIRSSHSRVVP